MRAAIALLICLALAVPAFAEPYRVVDVADGDTRKWSDPAYRAMLIFWGEVSGIGSTAGPC